MFGTLRLLLAIAVALSHAGVVFWGLNPGVIAVVVFYLISGYVIRVLLARQRAAGIGVLGFYGERLLRLAPQYGVYVALGALLWAAGASSPFLAAVPERSTWLANALVVPLNFYMFNGLDRFTLIPPAWSLGCEIQFYLLAPWLWSTTSRWRWRLLGVSLAVYLLAVSGWLHTDWYGYRLLPGVLWIFLLGGLLYELSRQRPLAPGATQSVGLVWLGHLLLLAWLWCQPGLAAPYNREVALGLALGTPLLALLAPLRQRRWDTWLGNLSYGLFLSHFSVLWAWSLLDVGASVPPLAPYLATATGLAWLSWRYVERPASVWRHRWFLPYTSHAHPR